MLIEKRHLPLVRFATFSVIFSFSVILSCSFSRFFFLLFHRFSDFSLLFQFPSFFLFIRLSSFSPFPCFHFSAFSSISRFSPILMLFKFLRFSVSSFLRFSVFPFFVLSFLVGFAVFYCFLSFSVSPFFCYSVFRFPFSRIPIFRFLRFFIFFSGFWLEMSLWN